jgi:hypothetical protein
MHLLGRAAIIGQLAQMQTKSGTLLPRFKAIPIAEIKATDSGD